MIKEKILLVCSTLEEGCSGVWCSLKLPSWGRGDVQCSGEQKTCYPISVLVEERATGDGVVACSTGWWYWYCVHVSEIGTHCTIRFAISIRFFCFEWAGVCMRAEWWAWGVACPPEPEATNLLESSKLTRSGRSGRSGQGLNKWLSFWGLLVLFVVTGNFYHEGNNFHRRSACEIYVDRFFMPRKSC